MPLTPPALATGFVAPNLNGTGNVGISVPTWSMGLAIGVCQFLTAEAKVSTIDAGLLGAGTSLMPMIVPTPLLQSSLFTSFAGLSLAGIKLPLFLVGLTTGLISGWSALAMLQCVHPSVGTGSGVARISGPTAVPAIMEGFSAVSMTGDGPAQVAQAIGQALDMTFASFVTPVVIVGSPSTAGSTGVGTGMVI